MPLETFVQAIDELEQRGCKQIAIATSKGAEAALLVAARDERVDAERL